MKKILCGVMVLMSLNMEAQHLTPADMVYLVGKPSELVNTFMVTKGFKIDSTGTIKYVYYGENLEVVWVDNFRGNAVTVKYGFFDRNHYINSMEYIENNSEMVSADSDDETVQEIYIYKKSHFFTVMVMKGPPTLYGFKVEKLY